MPMLVGREAILLAVGVLSGPMCIGGRCRGCRLFRDWLIFSVSRAVWLWYELLRVPILLLVLLACDVVAISMATKEPLPVELLWKLWMLDVSNAMLSFFLSTNVASDGESLGELYTLGIAGTGGTSSSKSLAVLWI